MGKTDSRIDTGTIQRIVGEDVVLDGEWVLDDGDPLWSEDDGGLDDDFVPEHRTDRVQEAEWRYYIGTTVLKHRSNESWAMAYLTIGFSLARSVASLMMRAWWWVALGGLMMAPLRLKWAVLRVVARYRAATRKTDWGYAMKRQILCTWSKRTFALAMTTLVTCFGWLIVAVVLHGITGALIATMVGSLVVLFSLAYALDVLADRADEGAMSVFLSKLKKPINAPTFWTYHPARGTARVAGAASLRRTPNDSA